MKKPEQQQRLDVVYPPHIFTESSNARPDSSVHGSSVENILSGI